MLDTIYSVLAPLVKRHEGLRLVGYICPAGYPTVGYGHTLGVRLPLTITMETAEQLLQEDMEIAVVQTLRYCPVLIDASPERQAAIADFVFNLGAGRLQASTLRRRINHGEYDLVPDELRKWKWGGGRILPGLVKRREEEAILWQSG